MATLTDIRTPRKPHTPGTRTAAATLLAIKESERTTP